jgi:hypothetical protein
MKKYLDFLAFVVLITLIGYNLTIITYGSILNENEPVWLESFKYYTLIPFGLWLVLFVVDSFLTRNKGDKISD